MRIPKLSTARAKVFAAIAANAPSALKRGGATLGATALIIGISISAPAFADSATDGTATAATTQSATADTGSSTDSTSTATTTTSDTTAATPTQAPVVAPAPAPAVVNPPAAPANDAAVVVPSTVPLVATSAQQNNHNGNDPPQQTACSLANPPTLTNTDAHLTTATFTIPRGVDTCDVSLHTYNTQGATWPTSGVQSEPVTFAHFQLTKWNPTKTLTVVPTGCFVQEDANIGTQAFNGLDGQLPHYNDSNTPTNLLASWNGKIDANCAPPKAPVSGTVVFNGTTCVANAPVGNSVVVSYTAPTTATFTLKGPLNEDGVVTNLPADTYTDSGIGTYGYPAVVHITLTGEDGSTLVFDHTFQAPKSTSDCAPPPPVDVCANIDGVQTTVPAGFVQDGVNCVPNPAVCTATTVDASVWSTENTAPTTGPNGADYVTLTNSDKVNFFGRTLNIPFASINSGAYTVENTGGAIAAYDMELWQQGVIGSNYGTVVFEPYVNGLTGTGTSGDGTFHTYVVGPNSLVWNTKLPVNTNTQGAQDHPITLTAMKELFPNAILWRAGNGQGSFNPGSHSTVSNFVDPACGSTTFPKTPPPVVTPPSGSVGSTCDYVNGGKVIAFTMTAGTNDANFTDYVGGKSVHTATVPAGTTVVYDYAVAEDSDATTAEIKVGEISLTSAIPVTTDCLTVTPAKPTLTGPTCSAPGTFVVPTDGDGYTVTDTPAGNGVGSHLLVYTAAEGKNFDQGNGTSISYTEDVLAATGNCPTSTTPKTPLAFTGVDITSPITWAIGLLIAGLLALVIHFRGQIVAFARRRLGRGEAA